MPYSKKPKNRALYIDVLFRKVPRDLWDHFKAHCALHGITCKSKFIANCRQTLVERKLG